MQRLFPESVPDLGVSTRVPEVYWNRCMAQGVPTRRELEQVLGDHALLLYAIVIVHRLPCLGSMGWVLFPSSLPSQALRPGLGGHSPGDVNVQQRCL